MPRGVPRLGSSSVDDVLETPGRNSPGSISETKIQNPNPSFTGWTTADGATINLDEAPPPWEADPGWLRDNTNARLFVDVPANWVLRWLNPRRIQQAGFRWWTPISAQDDRITLKVPSMRSPENYIRRDGQGGDILCMMPKHWVEAKDRQKAELVARKTQSSVDQTARVGESVRQATHGLIKVDSAVHPTHTMAEARDLDKTQ